MKISLKSLEFANCSVGNRPLPILFYILWKMEKLSPSNYQVYKLRTNPKDEKLTMHSLMVKYYKVIKGRDIQELEVACALLKSLLWVGILQVFQNKEAVQKEREGPSFTKCLAAVT
eukprot:11028660-Ditylum_brightwellii.AAC.1